MFSKAFFRGKQEEYGQLVEDVLTAQARLESGEAKEEEVLTPEGTRIQMEKAEDGAVHYSSVGSDVEFVGQRFPETGERPSSYPTDAPFLPSVRVSLTEIPENGWRSLSWHGVSDPTRRAKEIGEQLRGSGWVAGRVRRLFFGLFGVERQFTKDGITQRLLVHKLPGGKRKLSLIRRSRNRIASDAF